MFRLLLLCVFLGMSKSQKRIRPSTYSTSELDAFREFAALNVPSTKVAKVIDVVKNHPDLIGNTLIGSSDATRYWRARNGCKAALGEIASQVLVSERMTLRDGKEFVFKFAAPSAHLNYVLGHNECVREEWRCVMRERPPSATAPWRVLIGADEVYSGNPLPDSGRKVWILSWSFAELGLRRLQEFCFWSSSVIVRSAELKKLPGGFSRIFKIFVRRLFLDPTAGLKSAGMVVVCKGETLGFCGPRKCRRPSRTERVSAKSASGKERQASVAATNAAT